MKKVQIFVAAFIFSALSVFALLPASSVGALALDNACAGNGDSALCQNGTKDKNAGNVVGAVINTLLFIVGALSVVMIIIGGILYVVSQGDSGSVTKAKNTILYSVVGLVVAFLAYAIVNWVLHGVFHLL